MGAGLMAWGRKDGSMTTDEFLFLYNLGRSEKAKEWEKDERVSYDIYLIATLFLSLSSLLLPQENS